MIFSIICEELGLFGATLLILMFMFMIYRFMVIASNAPDLMGSLLVVGVMAHIGIQVILNIAVVTNTIPNTGVTLPFISYGGTSVLFLMLEMGMVLSVSNQIKLEGRCRRGGFSSEIKRKSSLSSYRFLPDGFRRPAVTKQEAGHRII